MPDQHPDYSALFAQAQLSVEALQRIAPLLDWARVNPPPPPEGGVAEGFEALTSHFSVLICWFKSHQREGYDGVLTGMKVFKLVRIPPDAGRVIFEAAKLSYTRKLQ